MGKYFFSGGMMPSHNLLFHFQDHLSIKKHWRVNGRHYNKTAEAWLKNIDRHRSEILPIMQKVYGVADAERWLQRWRIFFMACAELWGYRSGREWLVSHYLLEKRR
jgi:cyclopropane-fatty-acyl-phospholipid synthase